MLAQYQDSASTEQYEYQYKYGTMTSWNAQEGDCWRRLLEITSSSNKWCSERPPGAGEQNQ